MAFKAKMNLDMEAQPTCLLGTVAELDRACEIITGILASTRTRQADILAYPSLVASANEPGGVSVVDGAGRGGGSKRGRAPSSSPSRRVSKKVTVMSRRENAKARDVMEQGMPAPAPAPAPAPGKLSKVQRRKANTAAREALAAAAGPETAAAAGTEPGVPAPEEHQKTRRNRRAGNQRKGEKR